MKRRGILSALGACAVATPAAAASLPEWLLSRRTSRKPLLIAGSSAMVELNGALVTDFAKTHPEIDAVIEAGSSLSALIALKRGSIDVAAMDRDVTEAEDEYGLRNFLVARDGIDIVVNRQSAVPTLTSAQVRAIFEGQIGNWADVGGANAAIDIVALARGTPARRFLEENVLDGGQITPEGAIRQSSDELIEAVAGNPAAIGFTLLNDRQGGEKIRLLPIDGVEASPVTILSNRYPFAKSLYLALWNDEPDSPARLFVDFVRGPRGREIIEAHQMIATA